jgi:predicted MPP superfamily phosphohydrolase
MAEFFPVFFSLACLAILGGLEILLIKLLNRRWWQKRLIRGSAFILPGVGLITISVWVAGIYLEKKTIMFAGATLTALDLILILALMLSLPISGLINFIHDRMEKRQKGQQPTDTRGVNMPKRRLLKSAAAVMPVAALTSGLSGIANAFADVRVYKIDVPIPNLPPDLEGLKILHISDIHIGYYIELQDVEAVLEMARPFAPDLILATGDISDRLEVYGDCLDLMDQFNAPLGTYASIGNHEYFRGFRQVRRIFDKNPVPLLLNEGALLRKGNTEIYIGGADDPRSMRRIDESFFHQTIERSLRDAPGDSFKILMSHRPNAFDIAASYDIPLTFAGHTHGGQFGFAGQSIFETFFSGKYLWGLYENGSSRMYTSSGVGHWFPFRLGCPAEAPIIELRRVET